MTAILVVTVFLLALLAFLAWIVSELEKEREAYRRRQERARIARVERLAAGRISATTMQALQQMAQAAAPHWSACVCAHCIRRGGRP